MSKPVYKPVGEWKTSPIFLDEFANVLHPRPVIDRVFLDNLGKRMNVTDVQSNSFIHKVAQMVVDEIWGAQ